jgi:hypothetical protein
MLAAILCPGPSLTRTFDTDFGGLRIGVNRAVTAFACDWMAAIDWPLCRDWYPRALGKPALFSRAETADSFPESRTKSLESLFIFCPIALGWTNYSATAAIVLAAALGATQIDVYGADWTDEKDFDGVSIDGTDRTESRWAKERYIWRSVEAWLLVRGITVARRLAEG